MNDNKKKKKIEQIEHDVNEILRKLDHYYEMMIRKNAKPRLIIDNTKG